MSPRHDHDRDNEASVPDTEGRDGQRDLSSGEAKNPPDEPGCSRREFLKLSGLIAAGFGISGWADLIWTREGLAAIPVSEGYLLVDPKKCQGCLTCMLACSLVHEGVESLSLARIQVRQNSFSRWPDDLMIDQCRQCERPLCVEACPVGALKAEAEFGYVRMVKKDECLGCGACFRACPRTPKGAVVMPCGETCGESRPYSRKCDLCADTPFWHETGGPEGKQACVQVCPVGAIAFTSQLPEQEGDSGYKVNLRDRAWRKLGFPGTD
jgi:protein NrfC